MQMHRLPESPHPHERKAALQALARQTTVRTLLNPAHVLVALLPSVILPQGYAMSGIVDVAAFVVSLLALFVWGPLLMKRMRDALRTLRDRRGTKGSP